MYLSPVLQRGLVIGGVSLLAVVGMIGWTRHDAAPPAQPAAFMQPAPYEYGASVSNPTSNGQVVYGSSRLGPDQSPVYGYQPNVAPPAAAYTSPAYAAPAYTAPAYAAPAPPVVYRSAPPVTQSVVVRRYYYTRHGRRHYVVVHHRRPFSHSVAIVAGSAGAGALIGGLAGGGKGAGIGALAGGAGGLVYDRLTHKH